MKIPAMPQLANLATKIRTVNTFPIEDGFAIKFGEDGRELLWAHPKDWYDTTPNTLWYEVAYVVKFDNAGIPVAVVGCKGYDVSDLTARLLQGVTGTNASAACASQPDPEGATPEDILSITRKFCR